MFRWSSFITRIAILFLIGAAIWIGRHPLIQLALTDAIESTVGAKVEIGQVRSSFRENKLFIKDLTIADPRDPMRNLFQADSAILELDRDSLLKRRFKIVDGMTSQMVFGSPRLSSGAITDSGVRTKPFPTVSVAVEDGTSHQNLFDNFELKSPSGPPVSELQLSKSAKKIFANLNTSIGQHDSQVDSLKTLVREIHDLVNFDDNPLRNARKLKTAQQKVSELKLAVDSIGTALTALDRQISSHKSELTNAKNVDAQLLDSLSIKKEIDGQALSKLLLNQELAASAQEIVNWYLAFRESLPEPTRDFNLNPKYGQNVLIPGLSNIPPFLIEKMQLDGEGRLAGNKFSFSGDVHNIALDPSAHPLPVTFQLRAQGNTHFAVNCKLDRTSENIRDQLSVKCSDLVLASRDLDAQMMLVHVSPCRSKMDVQLMCTEDELSGTIEFDYDNLVMQIEQLDEIAGGQAVADRVNLDLASISGYRVSAEIEGDLAEPVVRFQTDLGNQFADKLNFAMNNVAAKPKIDLDAELQKHLSLLESHYSEKIRQIAYKLENEILGQQRAAVALLEQKLKNSTGSSLDLR